MTKRRPKPWRLAPEVEKIFAEARVLDSQPKQHHLIPQSYLRRWEKDGVLKVTVVDEGRSYPTSAAKAAREAHFYRIDSPDVDPDLIPPMLGETLLSRIEDIARPLIDELVDAPESFTDEDKAALALYLATQVTRGLAHRQSLEFLTNEWFRITYGNLSEQGARQRLMESSGRPPSPSEVKRAVADSKDLASGALRVVPQKASAVAMSFQFGRDLAPVIFDRTWVVYETSNILLTTDEPVVPIGDPLGLRRQRAGLASAAVVLFPLAPNRLLAMAHPDLAFIHTDEPSREGASRGRRRLDTLETTQVGRELLAHSHRWAFERPEKGLALRLDVPPLTEREQIEEFGPPASDGEEGTSRQMVRWYSANRWRDADQIPNLPFDWWWPDNLAR